nr:hypothetical protein CcurKRNrm2_p090 [Cryptomonas curvata]
MNKIRKRASFELHLKNNFLKFFHIYKFKMDNTNFKISFNKKRLAFINSNSVILFTNFEKYLFKNTIHKKNKNFESFNFSKSDFFLFKHVYSNFYLILNINFIHFKNFKKRILFKEKLKSKTNKQKKIQRLDNKNLLNVIISKMKDWSLNVYQKKQNFYPLFSLFYFRNLSNILQIKKIFIYANFEINPEYFQITSLCISSKVLLNLAVNKSIYSTNFIFFILKAIFYLISNNFPLLKKRTKKEIFLSAFLLYFFFNWSFLKYISQKIMIQMRNFYFFFQNLQLLFDIFKYTKNLSIFITIKIKNFIRIGEYIPNLLDLKDYLKTIIKSIFCKKIILLIYHFYEKISRYLYNEKLFETNLLDRMCLKIFIISKTQKQNDLLACKNEFICFFHELIYKPRCLCLNFFFINQVFILLKKQKKKIFLKNKFYIFLIKIFYSFLEYIDEFVFFFHISFIFLCIFKKKKKILFFLNAKKKKIMLKSLIKFKHFLNFKLFNIIENKVKYLQTYSDLRNFISKKKKKKEFFLKNTIKLCLKLLFIIYTINKTSKNMNNQNFFFYLVKNEKKQYLKIIQFLLYKFIFFLLVSEKEFFFSLFKSVKNNIIYLKYLINCSTKKFFLKLDFKTNLILNFPNLKTEICDIKNFWEKFYHTLLKKNIYDKFLKIKINFYSNQIFYNYTIYFFHFLVIYLLKKRKIKLYFISSSYFYRIFILVMLLNTNNYLPKFLFDYILLKNNRSSEKKISNLKNLFFNEISIKKKAFYINFYIKRYLHFSKFFYYKQNLNFIKINNFLPSEQNVETLIYILNNFFLELKFKKFKNKIKKIIKLSLKFTFFPFCFMYITICKLEREHSYHNLLDRKVDLILKKFQKNDFNSRINLAKFKKIFNSNFFGTYEIKFNSIL